MEEEIEMEVQKYLRTKLAEGDLDPLASLTNELSIKVSRSKEHPSLVSLRYSQTDSPKLHPIVRECRGVILDTDDYFRVVARGFDRFYNAGEYGADTIDWSRAIVQEKRDGSLILSYVYKGKLCFSSSSSVDLHEPLKSMVYVATSGYHRAEGSTPSPLFSSLTFIFELTGSDNRVVIPYGAAKLTLLGIRENLSGHEQPPTSVASLASYLKYDTPKTFSFASQKEAEASMVEMRGMQGEGYVVQCPNPDSYGKVNRVKVKNPAYVAIAHSKESAAAIVDIVRAGEDEELLTYYPDLAQEFSHVRAAYVKAIADVEAYYAEHGHKERKEFCMGVQSHPFSSALIQVKIGKQPSVVASLRAMDAKKLLGLLKG